MTHRGEVPLRSAIEIPEPTPAVESGSLPGGKNAVGPNFAWPTTVSRPAGLVVPMPTFVPVSKSRESVTFVPAALNFATRLGVPGPTLPAPPIGVHAPAEVTIPPETVMALGVLPVVQFAETPGVPPRW